MMMTKSSFYEMKVVAVLKRGFFAWEFFSFFFFFFS